MRAIECVPRQQFTADHLPVRSVEAGGSNKQGPNLHGLFGRASGSASGYSFSAAMKDAGQTWGKESLSAFILKPKSVVPGTKMAFAGMKKEAERNDIIAYLEKATV